MHPAVWDGLELFEEKKVVAPFVRINQLTCNKIHRFKGLKLENTLTTQASEYSPGSNYAWRYLFKSSWCTTLVCR